MKYRHLIFDIDGTLLDTEYAILHSLQDMLYHVKGEKRDLPDLKFVLGIPGDLALRKLGLGDDKEAAATWQRYMGNYSSAVKLFDGIPALLSSLQSEGIKLGIVTSKTKEEYTNEFLPYGIGAYFETVVCAGETALSKPFPDPLQEYLRRSGATTSECLYIGDTLYDMQCAEAAEVDFALALWGSPSVRHIRAAWYFRSPLDVIHSLEAYEDPYADHLLVKWAMELQFISQAGLTYSQDDFDRERFERLQEMAAEMMSWQTGFSVEQVQSLFCNETGFQTPKLDTRAAIFEEGKILLVKEKNGTWSLPGGWVDVNQSVKENTIKEVREEAGLEVVPVRLIAVQDRNRHNEPVYAYGICKVFVLCEVIGGEFCANCETLESRFFTPDELPVLAVEKNSVRQIAMCFDAYHSENWTTLFD